MPTMSLRAPRLRKQASRPIMSAIIAIIMGGMRSAVNTILALALALCASCRDCPPVDHHARYEPVVAKIRSLGLKPGERREYRLDDPANPATLRPDSESRLRPPGRDAGMIWAEKDEHGRLVIAFETLDRGHGGEWGYLYADRGVPMSRGQSTEGPGREWTLDCDLGGGWWWVSYRLG